MAHLKQKKPALYFYSSPILRLYHGGQILHLQPEAEGERLICFGQIIVFHSDEDGFSGFGGQQEGSGVDGFEVPGVLSLQLEDRSLE